MTYRETERETDRQTDRQRQREADRQTDSFKTARGNGVGISEYKLANNATQREN